MSTMASSGSTSSRRCKPVDTAGFSLPVAPPAIRKSRSARWRAAVLIAVHVLIGIHLVHWLSGGTTLTPLEPSESMAFSKSGVINAGLILFALSIVSTLFLGRWFCGWGCHLVALQDLAGWILKKLHIRPKPARLGLLGVVPFIAFVYMFIGPVVYRWVNGLPYSGVSTHFTTRDFWATFPDWIPAVLTFASCGFVIVYLLGAKGFCTYGCPYGGIFGLVDQLAPLRIRVTDACEGCGHCTAVCTSNVRVHQEVRDYAMVVDPGCMKCLDCVSVCPTHALYVGYGTPAITARRRTAAPKTGRSLRSWRGAAPGMLVLAAFLGASFSVLMAFDNNFDLRAIALLSAGSWIVALAFRGKAERPAEYTLGEEILIAALFIAAMGTYRGLYGGVPLLFAMGLSAMLAYWGISAARMVYRPNLALHGRQLKRDGRVAGWGCAFLAVTAIGLLLSVHSGIVQYNTQRGQRLYDQAMRWTTDPQIGWNPAALTPEQLGVVNRAARYLSTTIRLTLVPNPYDEVALANLYLLGGRVADYERHLARAIAAAPHDAALPQELGNYYASRNQPQLASASYRQALERARDAATFKGIAHGAWRLGDLDLAAEALSAALPLDAGNPRTHFECGVVAALRNQLDPALEHFRRAVELDPEYVDARENLAGMYCSRGQFEDGIREYLEALRRRPDDPATHELIARAYLALSRREEAESHVRRALELQPQQQTARQLLELMEQQDPESSGGVAPSPLLREIMNQIQAQPLGAHTVSTLALPEPLLRRIADRALRASFRQQFRRVAGGPLPALPRRSDEGKPPNARFDIRRHTVAPSILAYRRGLPAARPALRGFRAPLLDQANQSWPANPAGDADPDLRQAIDAVATRLADRGLLRTLVQVVATLGPQRVTTAAGPNVALLRATGLPVDLLDCFPVAGGDQPLAIVETVCRRLSAGETAAALADDVADWPFEFTAARPSFQVATESGEHPLGMFRLQIPTPALWHPAGAGGPLDITRQLMDAFPQAAMLITLHDRDLDAFDAEVRHWPAPPTFQAIVIGEPMPVAQWAQDNGKPGFIVDAESGRTQIATLAPRYASQREDGSLLVPNDSFLMDGLAAERHAVVQSALLFQGGNLLAVRDPTTAERILLIGEAAIRRNTALGLTAEQVLEAFRVEFAVDRCVVLPAVSFHLDLDVCVRAHDQRLVAFVNDPEAASRLIIGLGLSALGRTGVLEEPLITQARDHLNRRADAALAALLFPVLAEHADGRGALPESMAAAFSEGPTDSGPANLKRFLIALDELSAGLPDNPVAGTPYGQTYAESILRRRHDRLALHHQLRQQGWTVVPLPSLSDADYSINYLNGIHLRDRYLVPAYGGFYAALDDAAAAVLREALGASVVLTPIGCAAGQQRVGAIHCSVAAYPPPPVQK